VSVSGTYRLSGLWPPFAEAVRYLLQWCEYYNLRAEISSGYRSMEEQAALYAQGRTPDEILQRVSKRGAQGTVTDAAPGYSAHNYGLAVDIEGPDQRSVLSLAGQIGFGLVSWDPAHIEWPNWRSLTG
jgi:hypothetical protein